MLISAWSSDVCSSDLIDPGQFYRAHPQFVREFRIARGARRARRARPPRHFTQPLRPQIVATLHMRARRRLQSRPRPLRRAVEEGRSVEHTSELQSLMRISYAVFCLKKKITINDITINKYKSRR